MPSFGFILLMVSEKKIFKHFYENWPFLPPRQPIKYTDLDKSYMKHRGLLNKYFCKKISKYLHWDRKKCNFQLFPLKSMGTISCHSNRSSYRTGIKNITFRSPTYRCYMCNMERIRLTASEEMSFENVDGWTTDDRWTDGRWMPVYTISSPVSLRLRWAKNYVCPC